MLIKLTKNIVTREESREKGVTENCWILLAVFYQHNWINGTCSTQYKSRAETVTMIPREPLRARVLVACVWLVYTYCSDVRVLINLCPYHLSPTNLQSSEVENQLFPQNVCPCICVRLGACCRLF